MARVEKEELEKSIHKIVGNKVTVPSKISQQAASSKRYDKRGNEVDVLPEDQIMAIKTQAAGNSSYFVRVNRRKQLYDPYSSSYASESYRAAKIENLKVFDMISTSKESFESYIQYLKFGASQDLLTAQRTL